MNKHGFGILGLVVSCSSSDVYDGASTRGQALQSGDDLSSDDIVNEELPEEAPIEPLELPYTLKAQRCDDSSCRSVDISANFSAETMRQRELDLPFDEFVAEQFERSENVQRYSSEVLRAASESIASGSPEAPMHIALYLPEEFFDFGRLRGVTDEDRVSLWSERAEQLEPSQTVARVIVEQLGGTFDGSLQLANIAYVTVPAAAIESVIRLDGILGASLLPSEEPSANGVERRLALAWNSDGLQSWGWDGNQGGS